jgi:hypothetical protein
MFWEELIVCFLLIRYGQNEEDMSKSYYSVRCVFVAVAKFQIEQLPCNNRGNPNTDTDRREL